MNCTLENSWLHDNFNGEALGWHQNGFLSNGGSNFVIRHNSVNCVGGCTLDIGFIPDYNVSNAVVHKNLLVATFYGAFCLYPSSDHPAKPGIVSGMVVTDNVFSGGPTANARTTAQSTAGTRQTTIRDPTVMAMSGRVIYGIMGKRSAHHDVTGNWLS